MASDGLAPRPLIPAALINLGWWLGTAVAGFVAVVALRTSPPLSQASVPWVTPLALVALGLAAGAVTIIEIRSGFRTRDPVRFIRAAGWALLAASAVLGLAGLSTADAAVPGSAAITAILGGGCIAVALASEVLAPERAPLAGRQDAAAVGILFVGVELLTGLALAAQQVLLPLVAPAALVAAGALVVVACIHASGAARLPRSASSAVFAAAGIAGLGIARLDALEPALAAGLLAVGAAVSTRPAPGARGRVKIASAAQDRIADLGATLPDGLFLVDAALNVVAVGTARRGGQPLELTFLDGGGGSSQLRGVAQHVVARSDDADEVSRLTRELHATMEELLGTRHTLELQRAEIERATRVDTLTGLPNRAAILGRLEQEVAEARRYQHGVAVLIIDIDHFGAINRDHGLERADAALRELALRLRLRSREADALGRLSGDSFLAILPHSDERGVMTLGETLCRRIAGHPLVDGGRPLLVTVSGGAAVMAPHGDESGEALIGRAETALAEAQRQGGDQVAFDGLRRLPRHAASG